MQDKAVYWGYQAAWPNGPGIAKGIGRKQNRRSQVKEKAPERVPFRSFFK
jgi:hypothetical protein